MLIDYDFVEIGTWSDNILLLGRELLGEGKLDWSTWKSHDKTISHVR